VVARAARNPAQNLLSSACTAARPFLR
jgi:hypothetical protein